MMLTRLVAVALVAALGSGMAVAGTTGKIVGEVKDAQTGEALVGASVVVEGTRLGAATNIDATWARTLGRSWWATGAAGESTDHPASTTWTYNATVGTTPTGRLVVEIWGTNGAPADMRSLARARVAVSEPSERPPGRPTRHLTR